MALQKDKEYMFYIHILSAPRKEKKKKIVAERPG